MFLNGRVICPCDKVSISTSLEEIALISPIFMLMASQNKANVLQEKLLKIMRNTYTETIKQVVISVVLYIVQCFQMKFTLCL